MPVCVGVGPVAVEDVVVVDVVVLTALVGVPGTPTQ